MMVIKQTVLDYICYSNSRYNLWIAFWTIILSVGSVSAQQSTSLSQHDGPYILYQSGQRNLIRVYNGQLEVQQNSTPTFEVISENGEHRLIRIFLVGTQLCRRRFYNSVYWNNFFLPVDIGRQFIGLRLIDITNYT